MVLKKGVRLLDFLTSALALIRKGEPITTPRGDNVELEQSKGNLYDRDCSAQVTD
jgi:hypothetical protein